MTQKNIITVIQNGPLQIEGEVRIYNTMGELVEREPVEDEPPVMLCRCGASNNKPFCDGNHAKIGFQDGDESNHNLADNSKNEELDAFSPLTVSCRPDAMLVIRGPMTIVSADGQSRALRNKAAFCRCGASRNKPFCDISHKKINFSDDALHEKLAGDNAVVESAAEPPAELSTEPSAEGRPPENSITEDQVVATPVAQEPNKNSETKGE